MTLKQKAEKYRKKLSLNYGCYAYVVGIEIEKAWLSGFRAAKKQLK